MAAPTIVDSNAVQDNLGGSTTLTVTVPTHSEGDLLIMFWGPDNGREPWSQTTPTGWNKLAKDDSEGGTEIYTYWRVAGASEPSTYDWTLHTTFGQGQKGMVSISGAEDPGTTAIVAAGSFDTGSLGSTTSPAVTPTDADSLVLRICSSENASTFTVPSGETLEIQTAGSSTAVGISYFTHGTSSTGTNTWTYTPTSHTGFAHMVLAIAPTAGGVTGSPWYYYAQL